MFAMAEDVSNKELYRIINRALEKWGNFDDVSADTEIKIFSQRYNYRCQNNPQVNIFEEALPSPEAVSNAIQFCSDIETYRAHTDIYSDRDDSLSEDFYRRLYKGLERYAANITPNNDIKYKILKKSIQGFLPEFHEIQLLDQYNQEISIIQELKKKKNLEANIKANYFIKQFMNSEELKKIPTSPQKLELYQRSLAVVDSLSKDKFSRSYKFALKRDINKEIYKMATDLGAGYVEVAYKAKEEAERYQNAIDRAKQYATASNQFHPPRLSSTERNRRLMEEYWYR